MYRRDRNLTLSERIQIIRSNHRSTTKFILHDFDYLRYTITDDDIISLANALCQNTHIQQLLLVFDTYDMSHDISNILIELLENGSITVNDFGLGGYQIFQHHAEIFGMMLARNRSKFQVFSVRNAPMCKIGMQYILNGLASNESVTSIEFDGTFMDGDYSLSSKQLGQAFKSMLQRNNTLQRLKISNINLGTEFMLELTSAMETNKSIVEINL